MVYCCAHFTSNKRIWSQRNHNKRTKMKEKVKGKLIETKQKDGKNPK